MAKAQKVKTEEETLDVKNELKLDKISGDAKTETIKFETAAEGSLSPEERLARTKQIRANLGQRFRAVVDYTDHGFSSGKHLESFVVQK